MIENIEDLIGEDHACEWTNWHNRESVWAIYREGFIGFGGFEWLRHRV
ncbi:hypothetical protein [uncultured Bifidobacterium sp.]|nr:hypothetical protein [uncultured Bifidobacterium sp.]